MLFCTYHFISGFHLHSDNLFQLCKIHCGITNYLYAVTFGALYLALTEKYFKIFYPFKCERIYTKLTIATINLMCHVLCVALAIYSAVDFTEPKHRCFCYNISNVKGNILNGIVMVFLVSQKFVFSVRIIFKAKAQQRKIFVQRMIVSGNENN